MKEYPIIMSGNHPKLILDGIKTQTRRVIKPQPKVTLSWKTDGIIKFPYGQVGDRLWVRETHYRWGLWAKNGIAKAGRQKWTFKAVSNTVGGLRFPDNNPPFGSNDRTLMGWHKRPSIFMPRWASRITLEITEVRVEHLRDISEADAKAEGGYTIEEFIDLFIRINHLPADADPWNWVLGW